VGPLDAALYGTVARMLTKVCADVDPHRESLCRLPANPGEHESVQIASRPESASESSIRAKPSVCVVHATLGLCVQFASRNAGHPEQIASCHPEPVASESMHYDSYPVQIARPY
jgi:hypothetical protein